MTLPCQACLRRMDDKSGHFTPFTAVDSVVALCRSCWGSLTPEERLPYYRRIYEAWMGVEPSWNRTSCRLIPGGREEFAWAWERIECEVLNGK